MGYVGLGKVFSSRRSLRFCSFSSVVYQDVLGRKILWMVMGREWWFNKSVRAISREPASGVTALSILAANVSVHIRCRRRVVRVIEGLVGLGE